MRRHKVGAVGLLQFGCFLQVEVEQRLQICSDEGVAQIKNSVLCSGLDLLSGVKCERSQTSVRSKSFENVENRLWCNTELIAVKYGSSFSTDRVFSVHSRAVDLSHMHNGMSDENQGRHCHA